MAFEGDNSTFIPTSHKAVGLACMLALTLVGSACADRIAFINDPSLPCSLDQDCADTLFCFEGKCLHSGEPRCGDGILQADRGEHCDDGNQLGDGFLGDRSSLRQVDVF